MRKGILSITVLVLITIQSNSHTGWVLQNAGTNSTLRAIYMLNASTGFVAGTGIILKTTNGGNNWLNVTGVGYDYYDIQFLDTSFGYVTGHFKPATLHKSTNGGLNWILVHYPPIGYFPYSMKFFDQNTGFILTSKTTNAGLSWINTYPSLTMQSIFFINANTGWECNLIGTVIKTTNSGENWITVNAVPGIGLQCIFFTDTLTGWAVSNTSRVYKTTNGGMNWTMIYNQGYCGLNTLYFVNGQTGWIAGCEGTIHKTTNGGLNWVLQSIASTTYLYDLYFVSSGTGWAVGANGMILKTTNGGITSVESVTNHVPDRFELCQNYPNPFNPVTKIKFETPSQPSPKGSEQVVRLVIFDILGREVQTLVNEEFSPGTYEVNFNGINLPSGVYFYQLTISNEQLAIIYTETRKMVLLK